VSWWHRVGAINPHDHAAPWNDSVSASSSDRYACAEFQPMPSGHARAVFSESITVGHHRLGDAAWATLSSRPSEMLAAD